MPRIALVAGEASGDLLAAHLIQALKRKLPQVSFCGIGGPKMQQAGCDNWWPAEDLAVRGYFEVLKHYRRITALRRELLQRLLQSPPDVFIGVDAPDFNLWLEQRLKQAGIKTIHYVSPSVWAWRGGRIKSLARAADHLLALFPFEPPLYQPVGLAVSYVGHPLADMLPLEVDRAAARQRLALVGDSTAIFAMLPGSRQSELQYMGASFVRTIALLHQRYPQAQFLVPLASPQTREIFSAALAGEAAASAVRLLDGQAHDALAACDVALVASGTATLEAALLKAPMVVTYRMSPWSWGIMRHMHYQPWVALPNILAADFIVPELIQDQATPEKLSHALSKILEDRGGREVLQQRFHEMHLQLRQNTAEKAAAAVLSVMGVADV